MTGHGRSLRFPVFALEVSRHAKIRFSALILCDPRDRIVIRYVLPGSAKQVRCAGSRFAALRSALLFKSDHQGHAGGRYSCAKVRPAPRESSISRFVSFCKYRTNSESRLLIPHIELSSAATGKKCGFTPMSIYPASLQAGDGPGEQAGFQIFVSLSRISRSSGFPLYFKSAI